MSTSLIEEETHATFRRRPCWKPTYGAIENALPVSLVEDPSRQYLSMRSFYLVTKYAMAAQLTSINLHDLRHRFGFRMAEQVPLLRLAQLMGHDSLETTRPGYTARCATHR
jgi:integrase